MAQAIILVFVGGAVGAVMRELLMLGVPTARDGFVWSIFVANVVASLILGLITGLHARQALGAKANLLLGTGLCGGMSTFSSLVYATYVLLAGSALSAGVGLAYVGANLVVGFVLVLAGLRVGDVIGARKA
ncbi:fluoride ion transporter CrcB [Sphingomonas sp. ABOLG]|uniref:CrcB family protein n=1 Tax=Sphingomonas sp. ABOLG TaxID=1985880 RepID=UPI000F7E0264|nr:CrcB family protein [Sphingomonas sp. ABOLG]RSV13330.1 fluoride ion transporter CrcB [Sphingomonas sp. ABOLG]